jgi:hypothetical protein
MDKVLETSGSQCHIPSSKPFRIHSLELFEPEEEGPAILSHGGNCSSLHRRHKKHVCIAVVPNVSDILYTCSSMHTLRHIHKDEVVFFLNAFPRSDK